MGSRRGSLVNLAGEVRRGVKEMWEGMGTSEVKV